VLSRGGGHQHNLNTRGAFLHVLGDLFGSVATILAAVIIFFTGWYAADPLLSAVIGALVVFSAWSLLREAVDVLLEAAPQGMSIAAIRAAMERVPGVAGVHDLHVWTVTSGMPALSAHVETESMAHWEACLAALAATLREEFDIAHVTLQPEPPHTTPASRRDCALHAPDAPSDCITRGGRAPRAAHAGHRH
jgi:cobalt-zinc-cadmium efflux system protein